MEEIVFFLVFLWFFRPLQDDPPGIQYLKADSLTSFLCKLTFHRVAAESSFLLLFLSHHFCQAAGEASVSRGGGGRRGGVGEGG